MRKVCQFMKKNIKNPLEMKNVCMLLSKINQKSIENLQKNKTKQIANEICM